ncbi:MAG: alanine--tRNA ligase [Myxococcota bacterium]
MSSRDIRRTFLRYFEERDHALVPSAPLLLPNDPTLMFVNAGMAQFKDVFTGRDRRDYTRATSSQKCLRIKGKHNDLENVGQTARHHTFFEMLGNFSFGDYFKEKAIGYAWEFLTDVMGIEKDRMVITVFGGEDGIAADTEAERLWAEISGFSKDRIIRCGAKENFWTMGDTGPCGPCSELHYFIGDGDPDPKRFGEEPTPDGKGWTEIWNLVFMQFNRHADGTMEDLPAPSVDTGMGLERLSVLMQGVHSNYDTDLLRSIVDLAGEIAGKKYGGTMAKDDVSMRVIADHARTTAFLVAEGVFPDKGKREYVLRRVIRRAVRHGDRLGIHEPFLHRCALQVVEIMKDDYPELLERRDLIADITRSEEERFRRTLRAGLELLRKNDQWIPEADGGAAKKMLPGAVAFELYDTHGFPYDLQQVIGAEEGFDIDEAGFEAKREEARQRSRDGSKLDDQVADSYFALRQKLDATGFTGYEHERGRSTVTALLRNGTEVSSLAEGEDGEIIVAETPFYAESGGQVGDQGVIVTESGLAFRVTDTQRPVDGLWVHRGSVKNGSVRIGDEVDLQVDGDLRSQTRRNHSATHLLHYALRTVLGSQAMQKGSLVGPDRLRFDFSATRPLTAEEIRRIEDLVNAKILENAPVETEVLPMAEAKERGAIGIFEEKYGEVVRMLTMTSDSVELCGGTHALRTGDIGLFKILSDGGVSAGVRRIEAATGLRVLSHVREIEHELQETAALVKAPALKPRDKVARLLQQQKDLQKEIERLQKKLTSGGDRDLSADAQDINGVKVLGTQVDLGDAKALRELADQLRDKLAPAAILVGTEAKGGKALLACSVSKDATDRFNAGKIVRKAAQIVGGGGGGRADFAQAGGTDASKLSEAVQSIYS